MKRELAIIFIFLFLISAVSAAEIQMKNNYSSGETLIAKISGDFKTPILTDNIIFYRGHVKIPMDYDVGKINDNYYVYAMLPETGELTNYSVIVRGASYSQGNQIVSKDIIGNFTISPTRANFSVNPGFVITKTDFSINLQNFESHDLDISIKINKQGETKGFFASIFGSADEDTTSVAVKSGATSKIDFKLQDFNQSIFQTITMSTKSIEYTLPVYIFVDISEPQLEDFRFEPTESNISINVNSQKTKIIYIYNIGNTELNNIEISVSDSLRDYITLSRSYIDKLDDDSNIAIELTIKSGVNEALLNGFIYAQSADKIISLPITLDILEASQELPEDVDSYVLIKSCKDLNGVVCSSDEKCSKQEETASDGKCCLAECSSSSTGSSLKIIGIVLILVVIGILYWFFARRYFKVR